MEVAQKDVMWVSQVLALLDGVNELLKAEHLVIVDGELRASESIKNDPRFAWIKGL